MGLELELASDSRRESDFHDSPQCSAPRTGRLLDLAALTILAGSAHAQTPAGPESTPGQFFTITEPITNETIQQIRAATRQLVDRNAGEAKGKSPILVFEFLPGETAPGTSEFGTSLRPGQPDLQGAGRRQADRRLRPPAAQGLRRPAGRRLHGDRDGRRRDASARSPPRTRRSTPPSASRSGSSPCARRATPTCCWACSIATPTSGWSGRPTRPLHYVLAENLEEFRKTQPGQSRSSPPGKGASAAS